VTKKKGDMIWKMCRFPLLVAAETLVLQRRRIEIERAEIGGFAGVCA
jgi:hypothetical protein